MSAHFLNAARRAHEPGVVRLFFGWVWGKLVTPFAAVRRWWRRVRIWRSGVNHTWRWHDRWWLRIVRYLIYAVAVFFVLWLVRAFLVVLFDRNRYTQPFPFEFQPDTSCHDVTVECSALTGWATSVLSIVLASALFLLVRLSWTRLRYRRDARRRPRALVPTAGTIITMVVGRDELCQVVMEDLRIPRIRRPHVLVGGAGTGKTAVVVRMTELLARRGAVPVPIRLRGAEELDFTKLAKDQFLRQVDSHLGSEAEGEKTWRRLLRDGRIVVLADGLEEALCDEEGQPKALDRDTQIRNAIKEARERRLPLFITSRPHAPLRGMDATIHELEPLSASNALSYITGDTPSENDWRLSWIVEMADVTEAPLYLQITRELNRLDLLDDVVSREDQVLQGTTHDQATLRQRLLEAWASELVRGKLYQEVPLSRQEREVALDWISAFACLGLKNDSIEVPLEESLPADIEHMLEERAEKVVAETRGRDNLHGMNKRLAATWGAQLGLIQLREDRVRFEHSLVQAYLGSRLLGKFLTNKDYWRAALGDDQDNKDKKRPRPGRDFLISLVLYSRRVHTHAALRDVCDTLANAARDHAKDTKTLDIYAALLEIASAPGQSGECESLAEIGENIKDDWGSIRSDELHTLEEAKIGLMRRYGKALRTRAETAEDGGPDGELGYRQLYEICCKDTSYRVRLAGAQEIGDGGCAAYGELSGHLAKPIGKPADWNARQVTAWILPILITSMAPGCPDETGHRHGSAREQLEKWLKCVGPIGRDNRTEPDPGSPDGQWLQIPDEIALAQGFKYAANRRHSRLHTRPEEWSYLEDKALNMLGHASYWFSELTLVQALTLWAIPEGNGFAATPQGNGDPVPDGSPLDAEKTVDRWLEIIAAKSPGYRDSKGRSTHPFVKAAAVLAADALELRQPGRFVWMDESDAISRIGAGKPKAPPPSARKPRLWIPASAGWSALDSEAQQLLADVLLLLNLIERGAEPAKATERLAQGSKPAFANQLPPCLTRDRRSLHPLYTTGTADAERPGSSCLEDCQFRLCPYPPKGLQHHRTEIGEEFCRRQDRLVRYPRPRRRPARWQGMPARRLRAFWSQMAERARSSLG